MTKITPVWLSVGALASAAILSGCNDPRAEVATHRRLAEIDRVVNDFAEREADGPRRLAVMARRIEADSRWHDEMLARDLRRLADWAESDVRRWQERQPIYRERIADELDGDLQNANNTIPRLFY